MSQEAAAAAAAAAAVDPTVISMRWLQDLRLQNHSASPTDHVAMCESQNYSNSFEETLYYL